MNPALPRAGAVAATAAFASRELTPKLTPLR